MLTARPRAWARPVIGLALTGAIAAGSAVPAAAQDPGRSVEGTVTDARRGTPIVGATVGTGLPGRAVFTDSLGRYALAVPMGAHRLEVRATGFVPAWRTVIVVPGQPVRADVRLEPAVVTLPDVVVSTSREAQLAATTPLSVAVIGEAEIAESRAHHPSDLINRAPGVYVSNFGGEGHATAIRQPITTKAVYAFLEDGVPVRSTGFFNHNALYEINVPHAARLEVIKGPGSAVYGSDAIGGVINSFTREPTRELTGEAFVEGGSATYLRGLGTVSGSTGRHGFRADVNVTEADGWRDGASYQRQGGTLRWDAALAEGAKLKTVASASRIDQPGDGGSDLSADDYRNNPELVYTPIAFRTVRAVRLSSELQVQRGLSSLGVTAYARHNELDLLPSWQLSFDPQVWESRNGSLGLLTRYRRTIPAVRSSISAGVDVDYSPGSRRETRIERTQEGSVYTSYTLADIQYDYDVTFWQVSPFAQADVWLLENVQLSAGVRYDRIGYDYDNRLAPLGTGSHRRPASTTVDFARATPKLGASWQITPSTTVFGSYREAFRAPSESQLFRQGRAESTVDLEPVKARSWEAGVRSQVGGIVTVEATAYSMRLTDDIMTYVDPDGLRLTQNAGATSHRGLEVGVGVAPVRTLRLEASLAVMRHEYEDWDPNRQDPQLDFTGNEMELAPSLVGNTRLTYRPEALRDGSVSLEWVRLGSYWMDPANTMKYDGHDLFNAQANIPVVAGFDLVGRVSNLANVRFAETSSLTNAQQGPRYRPGAPRQFFLGGQYRFGR